MKARKRLQLHLSTALVLMLLAGGLVWLNVREKNAYEFGGVQEKSRAWYDNLYRARGWPLKYSIHRETKSQVFEYEGALGFPEPGFYLRPLLMNILTALAILTVAGVGCEWWLRRRGKDRPKVS